MSASVSVILLAGGTGSRMNNTTPKPFLPLKEKIIARYSFDLFCSLEQVREVVVVCPGDYQHHFSAKVRPTVRFAESGARRQDSVYSGLQQVSSDATLVCVHDSARPLLTKRVILDSFQEAEKHGAAVVGVPVKFTVKENDSNGMVKRTLDRAHLWEIQTPQVIRQPLLRQAFAHAIQNNLTVTDDVSLVEAIGHLVKIVKGEYSNIKITTPEDLLLAENLLRQQQPSLVP